MARKNILSSRKRQSLPKCGNSAKWRELDRSIQEVRKAFADMSADELEELIREAVQWARKKRQVRSPEVNVLLD